MVSAVLFITFFVLLVLNVPIAVCLGLSSAAAILYSGTSLTIVATNIYSGISKFLLLAIPFFVLSGNIMAKAGISTRLIRFVDTCVGHRKGGIANVCIIVACFFGAISGSGPATVAALGAVLIPAMVERGGFCSVLDGIDGNFQFHRDCHPAEYRVCCIRVDHGCFHRRYVYGRYHPGYPDGSGSGSCRYAGGTPQSCHAVQRREGIRKRALERI